MPSSALLYNSITNTKRAEFPATPWTSDGKKPTTSKNVVKVQFFLPKGQKVPEYEKLEIRLDGVVYKIREGYYEEGPDDQPWWSYFAHVE